MTRTVWATEVKEGDVIEGETVKTVRQIDGASVDNRRFRVETETGKVHVFQYWERVKVEAN